MSKNMLIAAFTASAVLLVVVLAVWARSYERVTVRVMQGKVYFILAKYRSSIYWIRSEGTTQDPVADRIEGVRQQAERQWDHFGLEYVGSDTMALKAFGLSLLYVAMVPLIGALWFGHLLRRRRRRERLGLCLSCGYDLRESGGRCPECGREPAAAAAADGARA